MRLIDADRLRREIAGKLSACLGFLGHMRDIGILESVLSDIDAQPSIDPVGHGRWVLEHGTYGAMRCSICKKECPLEKAQKPTYYREELLYIVSDYCPYCGAKMDLESEDTDENV